ncbi:unnamed protein product [Closterium sp. NIES-54]
MEDQVLGRPAEVFRRVREAMTHPAAVKDHCLWPAHLCNPHRRAGHRKPHSLCPAALCNPPSFLCDSSSTPHQGIGDWIYGKGRTNTHFLLNHRLPPHVCFPFPFPLSLPYPHQVIGDSVHGKGHTNAHFCLNHCLPALRCILRHLKIHLKGHTNAHFCLNHRLPISCVVAFPLPPLPPHPHPPPHSQVIGDSVHGKGRTNAHFRKTHRLPPSRLFLHASRLLLPLPALQPESPLMHAPEAESPLFTTPEAEYPLIHALAALEGDSAPLLPPGNEFPPSLPLEGEPFFFPALPIQSTLEPTVGRDGGFLEIVAPLPDDLIQVLLSLGLDIDPINGLNFSYSVPESPPHLVLRE